MRLNYLWQLVLEWHGNCICMMLILIQDLTGVISRRQAVDLNSHRQLPWYYKHID